MRIGACRTYFGFVATLVTSLASCGGKPNSEPAADAKPMAATERGANNAAPPSWPRYVLKAEKAWQLNAPKRERFDASALLLTPKGELLTLADRGPAVFQIRFLTNTNAADLIQINDWFTPAQLQPFARDKMDRYDCEGLAQDEQGRIYLSEEANRWILRLDPVKKSVERLPIDWTPVKKYFDLSDPNSSFEGVAVGHDRLYVANERQMGRIIVVDLASFKIVDNFSPHPSGSNARDIHFSDLSWHGETLYVLLRESRCVLAVTPASHRVLAEFDFKEMERDPEFLYRSLFPTGQMEGLAVDDQDIWLVTDNNGCGRARYPNDLRPTLFKCRRPDARTP